MTSTDEAARAVLQRYADTLEPPPAAEIIARAELSRAELSRAEVSRAGLLRAEPSRGRRRLVVAAASAAAAAVVAAVVAGQALDQHPSPTAAPSPAPASSSTARMVPGCPAAGPKPLASPLRVKAGRQLDVSVAIAPAEADRQVTSVTFVLVPPGQGVTDLYMVLARSPELAVVAGQERLSSALPIPADLAPGRYDLAADTTWPGPSLCGLENPAEPPFYGHSWVALDQVVVD